MEERSAFKPNPNLYYDLSKTFESAKQADEASTAFQEEFAQLRRKHKIPNVSVIAQFDFLDSEGESSQAILTFSFGDVMQQEPMLAYAYGRASADRQERISRILGDGARNAVRKPKHTE